MKNSEIILKYIDNHSNTVYQIAKSTGISESTISKWRKNPTSKIDVSVVQKIAMFYGITISELLDENQAARISISAHEQKLLEYYNELDDISKASVLGKAEGLAEAARRKKSLDAVPKKNSNPKIIPFQELSLPNEEYEVEEEYIDLPLPDIPASAGTGMYLDNAYAETIRVLSTDEALKADYAIRVSGNSMEPRYYDGDILAVCAQATVEPGEVGVFVYGSERYVKQFGGNRLISINPEYKDIYIKDNDSFFCQGKVISVLKLNRENKSNR